jgi:ferrous iron transport protein A
MIAAGPQRSGRDGAPLPKAPRYNENNSHFDPSMRLSELPRRTSATVEHVEDHMPNDSIARRLRELGFVSGETVQLMASGPIGAEPLLVQVGFTRFALRRAEAARVVLRNGDARE